MFLDALYYATDGNFHAKLKNGRGRLPSIGRVTFFADEEVFAAYQEELGPKVGGLYAALERYELTLARQPSTTRRRFGAMGCSPR